MSLRDTLRPRPMRRIAILAPATAARAVLSRVADRGTVELDRADRVEDTGANAAELLLQRLQTGQQQVTVAPALAPGVPDLDRLAAAGRADLLAGEAELTRHADQAVVHGQVAGWTGWAPADRLPELADGIAGVGGAVVVLAAPPGVDPPSAPAANPAAAPFRPLVNTYTTVPYADVDPTLPAGLAYVVMFGAMFGDAGHGLVLLLAGLAVRWVRRPRLAVLLRPHWSFITALGLSSMFFGFVYGEFFGPTGVITPWWVSPVDEPVKLMLGGIGLGVLLIAGAYVLGIVNRVREGGWAAALYAPSGLAGALLFLSAGLITVAWYTGSAPLGVAAGVVAVGALALAFAGFWAAAGRGATGLLQAVVEVFDMTVRLAANVVSFARLAAFGLTHAVLGWIIWTATTALWAAGPAGAVAAVVVFVLGNALAFALEALVAAVQALRLEYYELFSRVFQAQGRPFRPWHVPVAHGAPRSAAQLPTAQLPTAQLPTAQLPTVQPATDQRAQLPADQRVQEES